MTFYYLFFWVEFRRRKRVLKVIQGCIKLSQILISSPLLFDFFPKHIYKYIYRPIFDFQIYTSLSLSLCLSLSVSLCLFFSVSLYLSLSLFLSLSISLFISLSLSLSLSLSFSLFIYLSLSLSLPLSMYLSLSPSNYQFILKCIIFWHRKVRFLK